MGTQWRNDIRSSEVSGGASHGGRWDKVGQGGVGGGWEDRVRVRSELPVAGMGTGTARDRQAPLGRALTGGLGSLTWSAVGATDALLASRCLDQTRVIFNKAANVSSHHYAPKHEESACRTPAPCY